MKLVFDFLASRSTTPISRLVWVALIAAASSTMVLFALNSGAESAARGDDLGKLLIVFLVAEIVFIASNKYVQITTLRETEKGLYLYRQQQIERARHCDLATFERIGPARIFSAITQQTKLLSSSVAVMVMSVQFTVVVAFALLYLLWLNLAAFVLLTAILAAGGLVYRTRMKAAFVSFAAVVKRENEFFDSINDLVAGFKEIRLNAPRSRDFALHAGAISHDVFEVKGAIDVQFAQVFAFTHLVFFGAAAAMVFLLPGFGVVESTEVLKILSVVLFLIGPIVNVLGSAPAVAQAQSACTQMIALEKELEAAAAGSHAAPEQVRQFEEIRLARATYHHAASEEGTGFQVGPIDLTLRRGEALFISGGNGSGKSTLLRLLTALYLPQEGRIVLDGQTVNADRRETYQSLFSTVFSDFHLFERTFGLGNVDEAEAARWLTVMDLEEKTRFSHGRFETIRLSSGQRKRLALVVALLEDRPIYILDEFAADQDPEFRRKFYDEMLPILRERGKTLVVVTHDERYFDRASRHLRMEEGRIVRGEASG